MNMILILAEWTHFPTDKKPALNCLDNEGHIRNHI